MAGELKGKRIAFFAGPEGTEQIELITAWERIRRAGAEVKLLSLEPWEIQMFDHLDRANKMPVDGTVAEASAEDFDGLVLPRGVANPDAARMDRTPSGSSAVSSIAASPSPPSATRRGCSSRRTSSGAGR
jgi:putative intracellular protease/amidase